MDIKALDYSAYQGGLVRMLDRYQTEGTFTGDIAVDAYLCEVPEAALLGLLFDQRVRAETAFTGPYRLHERLGHLDMGTLAAMDEEALRAVFGEKPAVHRFTNKMADTTRAVAQHVVEAYDGVAERLWNDGADFATVEKRVRALPGFGPQKAAKMKFVLHYFGYRDFSDG